MKRLDKAYWSAWMLLSVFLPMVLLSSLHVHPELLIDNEPCHECIEHTVHNGHIAAVSIIGDNLLDKAYQSHLSRLKYADVNPVTGRMGVFNMGRNVTFKLDIPLTF